MTQKAKGVVGLARWTGLGIAGLACFWQCVFGLLSLAAIGIFSTIQSLVEGNIVGRTINRVARFFGTDLATLFPVDTLSIAFWAIATIIAVCTFIAFLIWFYVTGTKVFDTSLTALFTAITFALSILPGSNILPWILLWVFIIDLRSTVSSFGSLRPG
jgi:hypothetical protein